MAQYGSMNLKDFVAETLKQIIDGVVAAQEDGQGKGAVINPCGRTMSMKTRQVTETDDPQKQQMVEFDVAVTAAEGTQTKGGIGVFVAAVALGSQGQSNANMQSINRVKFSIPILLPPQKRPQVS